MSNVSETVSSPAYRRVDERGEFVEVIATGTWEAVLYGEMRAGDVLGHHYHRLTRIYFYLKTGNAEVTLVDVVSKTRSQRSLSPGQGIYLEPNQAHAIRFVEPSEFIMTKSRRHDPADPDTYPFHVELD